MTTTLAIDISVDTWLKYATATLPSHLHTAVPIFALVFVVLFFGLGWAWGLLWNKKWNPGTNNRWLMWGIISVICAFSLATADSLYGGNFNFFQSSVKEEVISTSGQDTISAEDTPNAYKIVKGVIDLTKDPMSDVEESQTPEVALTSGSVDSYANALALLWGVFWVFLILQVGSVAYGAYNDIKEIPHA